MDLTQASAPEQAALWNGRAGRAWVETQDLLDGMFQPFEDLLVETVRGGRGGRVLDIGCGTGSTTLALARLPETGGRCTGIDLSERMIGAARMRAEQENSPARFLAGDAQRFPFAPHSFDSIISRFGVMFFEDPVAAFANLRRAAAEAAELRLLVWRSAGENPFMTTAERAAAPFLPDLPARRADGPGQFAFADPRLVSVILNESGWSRIEIRPVDVECVLPEEGLDRYLTRLGPVGLFLDDADERVRAQVLETIRPAFTPFMQGGEVRFAAACWMVSAGQAQVGYS